MYWNLRRFSISSYKQISGSELSVTIVIPCAKLSISGVQRAITAVVGSILQYQDNTLVMNGVSLQIIHD